MDYPVNLDLLKAMRLFASTDSGRGVINQTIECAFDPAYHNADTRRVAPMYSNVMYAATNSYALAIGTAHADMDHPEQVVEAWITLHGQGNALVAVDAIDTLLKLKPKGAQNIAQYEKQCQLRIDTDGQDEWLTELCAPSWSSPWGQLSNRSFPRLESLLTIGSDRDGETVLTAHDEPQPTNRVAISTDNMTILLNAAKAIGAGVVNFHGRGGKKLTDDNGRVRQYFSIRDGKVAIVGLFMPIKTDYTWKAGE